MFSVYDGILASILLFLTNINDSNLCSYLKNTLAINPKISSSSNNRNFSFKTKFFHASIL